MNIMMYIYIVISFILGIAFERYIFPIFDNLLELLSYTLSRKANIIQLDVKRNLADFDRAYPETVEGYQEKVPAIGFHYEQPESMLEEDEEEEDCKNEMGFRM